MSADNYLLIKKRQGKFVLLYGVASNDYQSEKGVYDSLEEAVKASKGYDTEYGLKFNLEEATDSQQSNEVEANADAPRKLASSPSETNGADKELAQLVDKKLQEILGQNYVDEYSGAEQYIGTDEIATQLSASLLQYMDRVAREARYMGGVDFANWVIAHDESSFRQERAWFKIKPKLLTEYQLELMDGLDRIRTDAGIDPNATVRQIKHDPKASEGREV